MCTWYWRMWESLAFEYVQTCVGKNVSKIYIHAACVCRLTIEKVIYLQHSNFCNFTLWMSHQNTKRETRDASKSQINHARWNRTALKFGSENQLNVRSYLSILFCDFSLIAQSGKSHVAIILSKYVYLVMKNVRITGFWIRTKISLIGCPGP